MKPGWKRLIPLCLVLIVICLAGCGEYVNKVEPGGENGFSKDDYTFAKSMLKVKVQALDASPDISSDHISNVPLSLAISKGYQAMNNYDFEDAKKLGIDFPIGTVYQPSNYTRQLVDGHLYWIAVLSFIRLHSQAAYRQMKRMSIGIVVVDAEDETKPAQIRLRNAMGKPYQIKLHFRDVNWDDNYIGRFLLKKGYSKPKQYYRGAYSTAPYLDDITPEVEDGTWNLYYTCTDNQNQLKRYGGKWCCPKVRKVIIVNATTKKIQEYKKPEDVPAWVDRIYSEDSIVEYIQGWGFNLDNYMITSDKGKLVLDNNSLDVVVSADGKSLVYVGVMTSVNYDNSATGLIIVPTRSLKDAKYYPLYGPRAMATRNQAEQTVNAQNNYRGWKVEDLTIQWLYGRLTWEGSYTKPIVYAAQPEGDSTGDKIMGSTFMGCVLTPADADMNGSKVVWAETKKSAFDRYENMVFVKQTSNVGSKALAEYEGEGHIASLREIVDQGQTSLIFTLAEPQYQGYLFRLTIYDTFAMDTIEGLAAHIGDHIRFKYGDTKNSPTCFVKQFHDLDTSVWKSAKTPDKTVKY